MSERYRLTIAEEGRPVRVVLASDHEWVLLGLYEGVPVWWRSGITYHGAAWDGFLLWGDWMAWSGDHGEVFAVCSCHDPSPG